MDFDDKTFVLGVGAQKAGTTWLYEYFAKRDGIYMSPLKEMHYFDVKYRPKLCANIGERFGRRLKRKTARGRAGKAKKSAEIIRALEARVAFNGRSEAYREYFRESVPAAVNFFGEITPSYSLLGEDGFRDIRSLFRNIKLIFIMRDPAERFYSHVRYAKAKNPRKLHEALIKKRIRKARFIERTLYQNTIRNMEAVFKKEEIIYLFYEELFEEPTVRKLCQWIGIDYVAPDFGQIVNASKPRETVSPALWREIQETFLPTYAFCREKFGDRLPKSSLTAEENAQASSSLAARTAAL
jgi:hypothetical protein